MSVTALEAAKHACAASGWTLTNLQLQKILYIAHMIHLGRYGRPLIDDEMFQAWDYGPVLPTVYHRASAFGSSPVKDVFHSVPKLSDIFEEDEMRTLDEAVQKLQHVPPFRLVEMVHDDLGAWGRVYDPRFRNYTIPDHLIADEYRERFGR